MMDIGDWSFLGTAPGFVKKFCAGTKRALKRNHSKKNRQQAQRQLNDDEQPPTVRIGTRTRDYDPWTRTGRMF